MYPDVEFFPYKRLPELSQDHVQTDEVCLDVLRFIELNEGIDSIENICLLQPTSPFRESIHLNESFEKWENSCIYGAGCLVSGNKVLDVTENHGYMWSSNGGETVEPIGHNPQYRLGRQWEKPLPTQFFLENGAIYWFDAVEFSLKRSYRQPPFVMYEMDTQVDINTKEDWEEAERVILEDGWTIAKQRHH
jgi:CMP-N,N'-diacetyllegionaminic acid synthase